MDEIQDWEQLLSSNPKVLWGIVADVVKAIKAGEGERKTGRRPAVSVASLDELYAVLFPPQFTTAPFPVAFMQLLRDGGYNQVTFAAHVGFNQATVSRLASGKTLPSAEMIERLAWALDVRPTYFCEYRAIKLGRVVTDVLLAEPTLSAESVKRLVWAGVS